MTLYGRALLKADQLDAAERVLQQATRRFPVDPDAFLSYADVAERQGHLDAARTALLDYGSARAERRRLRVAGRAHRPLVARD